MNEKLSWNEGPALSLPEARLSIMHASGGQREPRKRERTEMAMETDGIPRSLRSRPGTSPEICYRTSLSSFFHLHLYLNNNNNSHPFCFFSKSLVFFFSYFLFFNIRKDAHKHILSPRDGDGPPRDAVHALQGAAPLAGLSAALERGAASV